MASSGPASPSEPAAAMRPLLAVDAPFLLYRSFFALPQTITGADGRPVGALLGLPTCSSASRSQIAPRAIVLCFGAEAAAYRVALYPAYHADRPPVPDALAWQFEQAPDFLRAFAWELLNSDALEADDLLGSLALTEAQSGGQDPDPHRRSRHVPVRRAEHLDPVPASGTQRL